MLSLSQTLTEKGNQVIDVLDFSGMLPPGNSPADITSPTSAPAPAAGGWLDRSLPVLQNRAVASGRVMYANGLLLDFPAALDRVLGKDTPYTWLGLLEPTSAAAYSALRDWAASLRRLTPGPLMMAWNDTARRLISTPRPVRRPDDSAAD